jgi:hypothetical protein
MRAQAYLTTCGRGNVANSTSTGVAAPLLIEQCLRCDAHSMQTSVGGCSRNTLAVRHNPTVSQDWRPRRIGSKPEGDVIVHDVGRQHEDHLIALVISHSESGTKHPKEASRLGQRHFLNLNDVPVSNEASNDKGLPIP